MSSQARGSPLPRVWDWQVFSAEEAAFIWSDVSEWVLWLVQRYDLGDEIPPCWWAHPAIVEELTALWASWNFAYRDSNADPRQPLAWHQELEASRRRIRAWDRQGCARGSHRADEPQAWAFSEEDFRSHVDADLVGRRSSEGLWE